MIKLINKVSNNQHIKNYKNKGGECWYVLDTQYISEKLMVDRTYLQLSFELITKRLIISNISLLKVILGMAFIFTILGFSLNHPIVNFYVHNASIMSLLVFLFALFLNSIMSALILIVLSFLSHLPKITINLIQLIKFNVLRLVQK